MASTKCIWNGSLSIAPNRRRRIGPASTRQNRSNVDAAKLHRSLPAIDEARGFQAALEFRGQTAAFEHLQHGRNLESLLHRLGDGRANRLRLSRPLDLDQH